MRLARHETCKQYVARRLSEGWSIVWQRGTHLILSSPNGSILRPVDLRNDVETLRPNAAGDLTEWASQYPDSTEHWDKVDEETADDDGTYVYHTGPLFEEKRDLYNLPAHSGSGTINFIKIYIRCKSGVMGDVSIAPSLKSNSTVSEGPEHNFTYSWEIYSYQFDTNPADEEPWEWSDIDALQIGIMVTYLSGAPEIAYCTQVYVEVDYTPGVTVHATYHGTISDTGGENCDYRGFVWDTTSRGDPGNTAPGDSAYASNWTEGNSYGVAAFSHQVTGLAGGNTFYVRACAHNSAGWSYGGEVDFYAPSLVRQAVAGVITSAGAIVKTTSKSVGAGLLSFSGMLVAVHTILKSIAGTLTSAGALVKTPAKTFSGVLSSSGAFEKFVKKMPSGTLTSAGSLTRNITKSLTGVLTSAGALNTTRYYELALSGVLNFAGSVTAELVAFSQACAGTLNMAGSLSKNMFLNVAGTLTSAGSVIKQTSKHCQGSIWYMAGALSRNISKAVSGTLTSSGSLAKVAMFAVACAGTLEMAGGVVKKTSKALAGTLTSSGAIKKWVKKSLGGTVSFAGTVSKFISKGVGGVLGLAGRLLTWIGGPPFRLRLHFEPGMKLRLTFKQDWDIKLTFKGGGE